MTWHCVCISNQKGGVGKTTTAVNLGLYLSRQARSVLIVDNDPQGNATSSLGLRGRNANGSLYEVLSGELPMEQACRSTDFKNVDLVPSSPHLAGLETERNQETDAMQFALARTLAACPRPYDYVLIDNPPSLGLLSVCGLVAAQSLVVPVQCEYLALEGLSSILRTIKRIRHALNPQLALGGFLLTLYDGRTRLSREVAADVRRHFPGETYTTIIPRSVRVAEAPSHGLPVAVYDPACAGAIAYEAWTREFLQRMNDWP